MSKRNKNKEGIFAKASRTMQEINEILDREGFALKVKQTITIVPKREE